MWNPFRRTANRRHVLSSSRITSPKQMKARLESVSYDALLQQFRADPSLAVAFAKSQLGFKDEPIGKKMLAEAAETDPAIRDRLIEKELASAGMNSSDPMQQFIAVKEFMERYSGDGNSRGPSLFDGLAKLLDNQMVAGALAGLITQIGQQSQQSQLGQRNMINRVTEQKPAQLEAAVGSPQNGTLQSSNGTSNEAVPANSTEVVTMTRGYLSHIAERIEQRVSPNSLAEYIMNCFIQVYKRETELTLDHNQSSIFQNIIQQNSEGIIILLKMMSAQNTDEPRFRYAVDFFTTEEGRSYLDEFCTERDKLVEQYNSQVGEGGKE